MSYVACVAKRVYRVRYSINPAWLKAVSLTVEHPKMCEWEFPTRPEAEAYRLGLTHATPHGLKDGVVITQFLVKPIEEYLIPAEGVPIEEIEK